MMNLITEFCHYMASEKMRSMNILDGMDESSQLSLF